MNTKKNEWEGFEFQKILAFANDKMKLKKYQTNIIHLAICGHFIAPYYPHFITAVDT